jgi:hypothetical protein
LNRVRSNREPRDGSSKSAAPVGTPIGLVHNAFALEVHRAIQVQGSANLPGLPRYLERDHDQELRRRIHEAVEGASTLVALVGGSSTGKTRACWEAIKNEELRVSGQRDHSRTRSRRLAQDEHALSLEARWRLLQRIDGSCRVTRGRVTATPRCQVREPPATTRSPLPGADLYIFRIAVPTEVAASGSKDARTGIA